MKNLVFLGLGIISLIQINCIGKKSFSTDNCARRYTVSDLLRDYDNSRSFLKLSNSEVFLDSFIVYKVLGADNNWVAEKYVFDPDSNLLTYQFYECCENIETAEFGIEVLGGALCRDSLKFFGNAYGVKAGVDGRKPVWYFSFPNPVFLENKVVMKSIRPNLEVKVDTLNLTTLNSRPAYASESFTDTLRFDFSSLFKLEGEELFIDSASFTLPTFLRYY